MVHKSVKPPVFETFTQHASEPDGQVFLHWHQGGLVPHSQPLVILEDVCEAGAVPLGEGAARAPRAEQGGIELLPEPNLQTRRSKKKKDA